MTLLLEWDRRGARAVIDQSTEGEISISEKNTFEKRSEVPPQQKPTAAAEGERTDGRTTAAKQGSDSTSTSGDACGSSESAANRLNK